MAEECIKMGFMVSFSGMLTFPKAQDIRDVPKRFLWKRLLIETDSPFLAPVPTEEGATNQPMWSRLARSLAQLRTLSPEAVGEITGGNYRQFFQVDLSCAWKIQIRSCYTSLKDVIMAAQNSLTSFPR